MHAFPGHDVYVAVLDMIADLHEEIAETMMQSPSHSRVQELLDEVARVRTAVTTATLEIRHEDALVTMLKSAVLLEDTVDEALTPLVGS